MLHDLFLALLGIEGDIFVVENDSCFALHDGLLEDNGGFVPLADKPRLERILNSGLTTESSRP